ncbi:MAG TPA: hypothetical protein VFV92_10445, partial [Candidatus Bathyarchaeia archaeon]|nr:hypothetical protein [Candidatus Bathyarchaeia archaeon]
RQSEDTPCEKDNTYRRGELLASFGLDAKLSISDLHTVTLTVRNRYDERQQSQHQEYNPD